MRIVIFSNGIISHPEQDRDQLKPDDVLFAADGGLHHCLRLKLTPHVLVGDLDSVDPEDVQMLREGGTEIIEHPARKDQTDLELAVNLAIDRGANEIIILGGLGGRWDQTLANILLITQDRFDAAEIQLIEGSQRILYLQPGRKHELSSRPGTTVSLIPIDGTAGGIRTSGLEYELEDGSLISGETRGVSNMMVADRASISFQEGGLICILIDGFDDLR